MMLRRSAPIAAALLLFCTTATAAPSWKDRQQAARLTQQGKILVKKGDFGQAADKFREADQLSPSPSVKLELARMLVALEKLREAGEIAAACTVDKPQQWIDRRAMKDCEKLAKELVDRTPTLALSVFEPEASQVTATVDGEPIDLTGEPVAFDPGEHEVVATADGYREFRETVVLAEGDRKGIEITLKKAEAAKAEEPVEADGEGISPIPAYVSWGVGAVGLGLGIGFGIAAIQSTNDVLREYGCEDEVCPEDAEEDLETAKLNGNISTAGFVIGFAGILTGTILFVFSDVVQGAEEGDEAEEATVLPAIGPGYVGVVGTF